MGAHKLCIRYTGRLLTGDLDDGMEGDLGGQKHVHEQFVCHKSPCESRGSLEPQGPMYRSLEVTRIGGGAATSEATKVEVRAGEVIASPGCRGSGRPGLVWPGFWADSAVHGHFCSETIVLRYNTGLMWTRPERRCAETDYGSQRAAPPPRHPLSLKQSILGNNLQLTRHSRSAHVLSVRNLMRNT